MIPTCGIVFDPVNFLSGESPGTARLTYRQGETIFVQGNQADCVFYVQQGNVKKSRVSRGGKERVISLVRVGVFFGTGSVIGRVERGTTATAMTVCTIVRIQLGVMLRLIYSEPAFAEMFISFL